MFATLVSKSGFLKRGPRPHFGATELFSGDHVQRPGRGLELKQRPKLGIFIDEQGATSVESLLKVFENHWF